MCYDYPMTNTEPNLFSTDPDVVAAALLNGDNKVNHFPVIAALPAPGRGGLIVLCHRVEGSHTPDFVTWAIWRTERGDIAAESGHYDMTLEEAIVDLHSRAGSLASFWQNITATVQRAERSAY